MTSPALRPPSLEYAKDFYFLTEVFLASAASPVRSSVKVNQLLELGFDPLSIAYAIAHAMQFPQDENTLFNLRFAAEHIGTNRPEFKDDIAAIIAVGATVPDGMADLPTAITGAQYLEQRGARGWESDREESDFGIFVSPDGALVSYDPPHFEPPDDVTEQPLSPPPEDPAPTRQFCPDGVTTFDPSANYLVDPCTPPVIARPINRRPEKQSALPWLLVIGAVVFFASQ